jgi:hypothetical protein
MRKAAIWIGVTALVVVVLGANAHLLYVAIASQPDCVAHRKPGTVAGADSGYSAAESACSAQGEGTAR